MAKMMEADANAHNKISNGTSITGDIESNGDIRMDGALNGNLKTKGKLVIGETGRVNGEITCKNADVEGKIEGKINVAELLTLKATSNINGDIVTSKLAIEPGAKFSGNCNMSGESVLTHAEKGGRPPQEEQRKAK
jgi:cytoskeletal protein CcmA (bactofilin family)